MLAPQNMALYMSRCRRLLLQKLLQTRLSFAAREFGLGNVNGDNLKGQHLLDLNESIYITPKGNHRGSVKESSVYLPGTNNWADAEVADGDEVRQLLSPSAITRIEENEPWLEPSFAPILIDFFKATQNKRKKD